jgi:hypothetical protein
MQEILGEEFQIAEPVRVSEDSDAAPRELETEPAVMRRGVTLVPPCEPGLR